MFVDCVFLVTGKQIQPDPLSSKNAKRRQFCSKHDGYGDFCDSKFAIANLKICCDVNGICGAVVHICWDIDAVNLSDSSFNALISPILVAQFLMFNSIYHFLCTGTHVDELLTPAPLSDKMLENHAIFRIPIAVIPGNVHIRDLCIQQQL